MEDVKRRLKYIVIFLFGLMFVLLLITPIRLVMLEVGSEFFTKSSLILGTKYVTENTDFNPSGCMIMAFDGELSCSLYKCDDGKTYLTRHQKYSNWGDAILNCIILRDSFSNNIYHS